MHNGVERRRRRAELERHPLQTTDGRLPAAVEGQQGRWPPVGHKTGTDQDGLRRRRRRQRQGWDDDAIVCAARPAAAAVTANGSEEDVRVPSAGMQVSRPRCGGGQAALLRRLLQDRTQGRRSRLLRRSLLVPAPVQHSLVLVHGRRLGQDGRVQDVGQKVVLLRGRRVLRPRPLRGRLLSLRVRKRLLTTGCGRRDELVAAITERCAN